ncbi:hypothetical protein ETQ85_24555 [Zoogloea oleivorans]|uniref:Uncharacterized protein n=1 Tax=Zoogloea oleivorans TaxID=1552750 RepID=A0A6C2CD27_9RHOO|nr:hypothetical protein [Zoogloea oleivorans]TYC51155.1 hypothetical protein ETQ85_24555 [Zoogloea oleivorans]
MRRPNPNLRQRPALKNPDELPFVVSGYVRHLLELRRVIDVYLPLIAELPSFEHLQRSLDELTRHIEEIEDWIAKYLDESSGLDFQDFDFEMRHLISDALETTLDSYPTAGGVIPDPASANEEQMQSDIESLTEQIWQVVRGQGYKLHASLHGAL